MQPFITAGQLLAHAWGDYVLQSDAMATQKLKSWRWALFHALAYSIPFVLFLRPSWSAWAVIVLTHAVIDRLRIARYVVYLKEWIFDPRAFLWLVGDLWEAGSRYEVNPWKSYPHPKPLSELPLGMDPEKPPHIAVWLLIIADNVMHVTINGAALRYL
jgi:hypothetical protein